MHGRSTREKISGITKDIEEGLIISPKRLKYLIRVKKQIMRAYEKFTDMKGEPGEKARSVIAQLEEEIAGYEAMLAGAGDTAARLEQAFRSGGARDIGKLLKLRDMMFEWEAEASGLQRYVRNLNTVSVDIGGGAAENALTRNAPAGL